MQLIEQTVCFDKKPRHGPARPLGPQSTSLFGPVIDFDHPRQFFLLEPHSFGRQTISLLFPRSSTCPPRILSVLEVFAPPKAFSLVPDHRLPVGKDLSTVQHHCFLSTFGFAIDQHRHRCKHISDKKSSQESWQSSMRRGGHVPKIPRDLRFSHISLECVFSAIKPRFRGFPFVVCQDV